MTNKIDTMDYMEDWMDKVFEAELEDMFMTNEEAEQTESFDLLALK